MTELLSVDEALKRIVSGKRRLPGEVVALDDALDRVLAEDIIAGISLPPFANSSMDGYAARAADIAGAGEAAPVTLRVVADIPAGAFPDMTLGPGEAARIMTGAPLPAGADTIVPVEHTDGHFAQDASEPPPDTVTVLHASQPGDYVRPIGEDIRAGERVLAAGTLLRAQELGVLAAIGRAAVPVVRRPRVAILSTGNELIPVGDPLPPGAIHDSNGYTLAALVRTHGGAAIRVPTARDTLDDVRRRFQEALDTQPDIIISSAGVSVGAFDVVRTVLAELGQVDFWRINLRPGKPLAYGELRGVPFFGLPGNPVSAMVTFDVFVRPTLMALSGRPDSWVTKRAIVAQPLESDGRQSYLRVKLQRENGQLIATTTGTQSSGALTSMVLADALLIIPEGVRHVDAGTLLEVRLLKPII